MNDNELGAFLRSRREAVSPAEVGLPLGPRRRTPGLRRAELATLAGISVEYLTRLEQGRDRRPSAQVLGALADALRLSPPDRINLLHAFKAASGEGHLLCQPSEPPDRAVRPTVQALLDALEPAPAVLLNRLTDVLAWTRGFELLARPIGLLDVEQPNLVQYVFTDPRARAVYPDWEEVADRRVSDLKVPASHADPHATALADHLAVTVGAPFADRLAAPRVSGHAGVERLVHPDAGELRLSFETLELADTEDQWLVVYLPADDATSAALTHLAARPITADHATSVRHASGPLLRAVEG
ncbi:MAG: helix-turn-helix domain-containing protein [Jiangellaceae bacterium]